MNQLRLSKSIPRRLFVYIRYSINVIYPVRYRGNQSTPLFKRSLSRSALFATSLFAFRVCAVAVCANNESEAIRASLVANFYLRLFLEQFLDSGIYPIRRRYSAFIDERKLRSHRRRGVCHSRSSSLFFFSLSSCLFLPFFNTPRQVSRIRCSWLE